jgi:hypothetical protein
MPKDGSNLHEMGFQPDMMINIIKRKWPRDGAYEKRMENGKRLF